MNFLCVPETKIAVESLLSNSGQRMASPSSGDTIPISACIVDAISSPTSQRIWNPRAPAGGTFRAAIGKVTQAPIAGTFTVGFGSQTSGVLVSGKHYLISLFVSGDDFTNVGAGSNATGVTFTATGTTPTTWTHSSVLIEITTALAYNASTSDLQTALNALHSISVLSPAGVVVTAVAGFYLVTFNATGGQPQLTAYATNLAPTGTIAEIGTDLQGDTGINEVQSLRFVQSPAASADLTDAAPAAAGTSTTVVTGGGGANAVYQILLYTVGMDGSILNAPYDGQFSLGLGGVTSGLIAFDASAADVVTALSAMSNIGPGIGSPVVPNVTVSNPAPGVYVIGFQGELANTNLGAMTINADALLVVPFMIGVLPLTTAPIQLLFGTAATVAVVFSITFTPAGGAPFEVFRSNITLVQPLIAPGATLPGPIILYWDAIETQAAIDASILAAAGTAATQTLTGGIPSTSFTTGTLIVDGGVGISGDIFGNGNIDAAGFSLFGTNALGREFVDSTWRWVSDTFFHAPRLIGDGIEAGAAGHLFFNLAIAGGFPANGDKELLLQSDQADVNVFALQNLDAGGYSAISFRDDSDVELMAVGHGNSGAAAIFAGVNYIETWSGISGAGAPKVLRICADGDYGATGSGFRFYQRLSIEATGVVKLWKLIPWGTSQVELVTFDDALVTVATALTATGAVTASSTLTSTGAFTASAAATVTGTLTANGSLVANSTVTLSPASGVITINPTAAGTINNMSVGQTTAAAVTATTFRVNTNAKIGGSGTIMSQIQFGVTTLVAGTVTVGAATVTANTRILATVQTLGTVAAPKPIAVTARAVGASFTLTSSDATDTSVIAFMLIEP